MVDLICLHGPLFLASAGTTLHSTCCAAVGLLARDVVAYLLCCPVICVCTPLPLAAVHAILWPLGAAPIIAGLVMGRLHGLWNDGHVIIYACVHFLLLSVSVYHSYLVAEVGLARLTFCNLLC